jgi:acyl-CoA thioester hydrolase
MTEDWFSYPIQVFPHHTDYAGVVWHGRYVQWLEEARVELLRSRGIDYAKLVALGCGLHVVNLNIRYLRPLRMGDQAILKTRIAPLEGVRIPIESELRSLDHEVLYLTSQVILVALDIEKNRVMRKLPPDVQAVLI